MIYLLFKEHMPWNLKQDSKTKYRKGPDDESIV